MKGHKLIALTAGIALGALFVGCEAATNINTNTNGNIAVVTTGNGNANANANTNADRRIVNANITREEYERQRESFAEEARRLGRTIGSGANDGWLWTKTRAVLAAADDLRDSTINVDVDNAVVTLSGTVASQAQKTRAEQVARGVEGVSSVRNNLAVSVTEGNTNQNANRNANTRP